MSFAPTVAGTGCNASIRGKADNIDCSASGFCPSSQDSAVLYSSSRYYQEFRRLSFCLLVRLESSIRNNGVSWNCLSWGSRVECSYKNLVVKGTIYKEQSTRLGSTNTTTIIVRTGTLLKPLSQRDWINRELDLIQIRKITNPCWQAHVITCPDWWNVSNCWTVGYR
jgi:hypothetical protein